MEGVPPDFLSLRVGDAPFPTPTAPPPPPPPPRAAALLDEIVEEILLRVPPDDPARLLRAALACKRWAVLLADPGFRRRYRVRHGGLPPLLGLLANQIATGGSARFVPTLGFSPARAAHRNHRAHDARHGRVLLNRITWARRGGGGAAQEAQDQEHALAVWDPFTDEHRPLPPLLLPQQVRSWNAAVLCAGGPNCDHLDCVPGHFLVAFVGIDGEKVLAHVYSSETGAWGGEGAGSTQLPGDVFDESLPGALAQNALYFVFQSGNRMLKYDLATRKQSLIFLPNRPYARRLMTMEDGELGFAEVDSHFNLKLWSMAPGPEGDAGKWDVNRAIDLSAHLPAPALGATPCVVAFAEVVGVIFLKTTDGLYTFNLKTEQSIRVMANDFYDVIPYVSFYTPGTSTCSVSCRPC
jgi:hypothetical protein